MIASQHTAVVITGGASGIGAACATALAEVGRPVVLWDLQADAATAHAAALGAAHGVATIGLGLDVTDSNAITDAAVVSRAIGPIGGVVHAAGVVAIDGIGQLDEGKWGRVIDVNLRAFAFVVQALLDDLRGTPGASAVGIASIEGLVGNGAIPAYCASKAGLIGLVRSMAHQFGPVGIRVNAVCPGYIDTPMLADALAIEGLRETFAGQSVLGRVGEPRDIATAVRFLLSSDAAFITGTHLVVDGGVTAVR